MTYETPKFEVKKEIANILQSQAANVSLGRKVSRENVCP